LPLTVRETTRVPMGTYRALSFGLVRYPVGVTAVYLEGAATRQTDLSRESHGPRAVLNALERLVGGYGPESERIREDLVIAESQLRDYQAQLGVPFLHDSYLSELTALRDELKMGLSGQHPESSSEPPPSVAEFARRIKTLKAAQSVEAIPLRVSQKPLSAAEPVTARIRRRAQVVSVSDPMVQPNASVSIARTAPPAQSNGQAPKPQTTFRDRLAMERQRQNPDLPQPVNRH
jgi:hypothetical protein